MCVCVCLFYCVCTYVCVHVCMCVCMSVACVFVCFHVCACVCGGQITTSDVILRNSYYLSYVPISVIKYPDKGNLREKVWLILVYSFTVLQSIMVGKIWQQECGLAHHIALEVRKQREQEVESGYRNLNENDLQSSYI